MAKSSHYAKWWEWTWDYPRIVSQWASNGKFNKVSISCFFSWDIIRFFVAWVVWTDPTCFNTTLVTFMSCDLNTVAEWKCKKVGRWTEPVLTPGNTKSSCQSYVTRTLRHMIKIWCFCLFVCQLFRGICVVSFPGCCSNLAQLLWHCGVMESMEINERENVIFLRLSNYKNTLFLLCSCTSQKPSHGDISGTKSGIIDPLVLKNHPVFTFNLDMVPTTCNSL